MKTGSQSRVFDYETGSVNTHEGPIPQDFKTEKPPFASVDIDLVGETFEQRLIRLGKIAPKGENPGGSEMSGEMQKQVFGDFTIISSPVKRETRIINLPTEVHPGSS